MKYLIGIAAIGGALFMAIPGGIVLWMGLRSVWHGLASSHWPTVSGVVLRAGMTEDQAKGVNLLFVAVVIVALGSLLGEMLGVYQLLGKFWFWFGHQGWEYLDLGRGWQLLLALGLILWLALVFKGSAPARRDPEKREITTLFLLAALAIPLFYGVGWLINMETVSFYVNNTEIKASKDSSILEATRNAEIYIPSLCYHPDLPLSRRAKAGNAVFRAGEQITCDAAEKEFEGCNLCLVEVEGKPDPVPACDTIVAEGMRVHTDTERVREARQEKLMRILARHPHACLICAQKKAAPASHVPPTCPCLNDAAANSATAS
jgi:hypothetical protein